MAKSEKQGFAEIPLIKFQDYPVDIHIRVCRQGARYCAEVLALGKFQKVPIDISPEDLKNLNGEFQKALQATVDLQCGGANPELNQQIQLRNLAFAGNYAFKRVFGHSIAEKTILHLLNLGHKLNRRLSIQVASEDFFLPWELLYSDDPCEPDYELFWGMKYILSRVVVQETRPGDFVPPIIPVREKPKLGLMTYRGLPGVARKEEPFFQQLAGDDKISLEQLPPLDPKKKDAEFEQFKHFWKKALDLAHLACHAFYKDESPSLSYILLSNEFPISLREMEVYRITINSHPLIILNACKTGHLNPMNTSQFSRIFLKCGARGVVATECAVSDTFAADFARQLYAHLLNREPLGESLLATRRYFLEKHHNPSGLLYSMYASPSIRLSSVDTSDGESQNAS